MVRWEIKDILKHYLPDVGEETLASLTKQVEREMEACGNEAIRKIVGEFDRGGFAHKLDIKA